MPDGLGDDLSRMSFGTGSPAEMSDQPSGLGQVAGGMYTGLGELAKKMFGQSEELRAGRGYNAGPAVQTTLGAMGGPLVGATKAAGETVLGSGPVIKAYHSSPHDFTKFDTSRIGTGEGAQSYGHGLYFAENPAVSGQGGQYWNQFLRKFVPNEREAAKVLQTTQFDRDAAAAKIAQYIEDARAAQGAPTEWNRTIDFAQRTKDYERQLELLKSGGPVGPRTYEVDINADPATMLNWDKAIADQPSAVQDVYREMFPQGKSSWGFEPRTGADLHNTAAAELARGTTQRRDAVRLADTLRDAGVPGIRYLDEGSRLPRSMSDLESRIARANDQLETWRKLPNDRTQPLMMQSLTEELADLNTQLVKAKITPQTSNYVVFDPNIIDIRKVYGVGSDAGLGNAFAASMMSRHPEQFLPPQAPVTRENLT